MRTRHQHENNHTHTCFWQLSALWIAKIQLCNGWIYLPVLKDKYIVYLTVSISTLIIRHKHRNSTGKTMVGCWEIGFHEWQSPSGVTGRATRYTVTDQTVYRQAFWGDTQVTDGAGHAPDSLFATPTDAESTHCLHGGDTGINHGFQLGQSREFGVRRFRDGGQTKPYPCAASSDNGHLLPAPPQWIHGISWSPAGIGGWRG